MKKRAKASQGSQDERLSLLLANSADVGRRHLYLFGEINEESAYRFVLGLHTLDETDGQIVVIMNSPGGSCDDGFAIYDAIRLTRNPVCIVGMGQVASAASIIMQAADKRVLSSESEFMIHDIAVTATDSMSLKEVSTLHTDLHRSQKRQIRILAHRSGQSVEQLEKWCAAETTFNAQQAFEAGFIDTVIGGESK